ncbi:MAG: SH3 domain-containing protein, partial [Spirochaetaceae bacterium]|nr:SH3 domain-containing protein [Spirochaetaceae bacterium]
LLAFLCGMLLSCERTLGWGMLLWSTEDPDIPSGTVLPVYIRSNIDLVWVAGIPDVYRATKRDGLDKFEIPLPQLELVGGKGAALKRAGEFAEYALLYAETLQDGLPIRESTDNNSRRVYRLRGGEIIKILSKSEGVPAISTTGDPLPGDWYQVLTKDGNTGYCFSYRLRLFEHRGGPFYVERTETENTEDPDLEFVLSQNWYPESYGTMVASGKIDIEELGKKWQFFPGQDSGLARIHAAGLDRTFPYTNIKRDGRRSWHFEGASLQMILRGESLLAVQYSDDGGAMRTLLFVTLPASLEDLIVQETERRNTLYQNLFTQGPYFTSSNYGAISFTANGRFIWNGNSLLVPQIIPPATPDSGAVEMRLFLGPSLEGLYNGAFTLRFDGAEAAGFPVHFLYTLDSQGLRLEHISEENIDETTVTRRAASPTIIYFFK